MKSRLLTHAVLVTLFSTSLVHGAETAPWLTVDGQANFDVRKSSTQDYESNLRVQDAEVKFELLVREGIKIALKTDLEQRLNKETRKQDFDWEKAIEEAYIQIQTDKVSGLPKATITFGKHGMAFGQKYHELPMFKDSLITKLTKKTEVIGVTVDLPTEFFKIIDSVAISVFEATSGDFKIANEKGASMRLTKKISDQMTAQISALMSEKVNSSDLEKRGSVGFIFTTKDGKRKIWAEGVIVDDSPLFDKTTLGAQVGASSQLGAGTIVIEYQYLQDQAHEVAVAYNLPVGTWLVLSPEIRHRKDLSGTKEDETVIGIRARIKAHLEVKHNLLKGNEN